MSLGTEDVGRSERGHVGGGESYRALVSYAAKVDSVRHVFYERVEQHL